MIQNAEISYLKTAPVVDDNRPARYSTYTQTLEGGQDFAGVWISERGSRYLCDGQEFVCISVHGPRFVGWIGKTAVKILQPTGTDWSGLQAIRSMRSGVLSHWVPVSLSIDVDIVTKKFPANVRSDLLVNGYIEYYRRIQLDG